ncbi:MAG: hypothetical protein ACTS7I_01590 [Candidatus Hodgkinia cicadicola]
MLLATGVPLSLSLRLTSEHGGRFGSPFVLGQICFSPLGSGKKENGERIRKLWTEIYLEWAALLRHNRREMLNWKAAERFERFNRRKC